MGVKAWVRVSTFEMNGAEPPTLLYEKVIDIGRSNRREWLSRHMVWAALNGNGVQVERDWSR